MFIAVFDVDHSVQVSTAIVPVLDTARGFVSSQLFDIHVVEDHRFNVGAAFGGHRIVGEFRIRRCEDCRLCVVEV